MMCGKELDEGLFFCSECETKAESEPQEISDRNLKMWEEIYAEEKRRESEDNE